MATTTTSILDSLNKYGVCFVSGAIPFPLKNWISHLNVMFLRILCNLMTCAFVASMSLSTKGVPQLYEKNIYLIGYFFLNVTFQNAARSYFIMLRISIF